MNFKFYQHLFFFLFFLNFILNVESNRQIEIKNIRFNSSYPIFNKKQNNNIDQNQLSFSKSIHNFAGNNTDNNSLSDWIKEETALFIIIIVVVVIVIIIIIVLIIVCRRMNNRFNELQIQVNKISFQSDIRETTQGGDNDKLI